MPYKLLAVERHIMVYDVHDNLTGDYLIDIPIEELVKIINPRPGDTNLYDSYVLNSEQLKVISNRISEPPLVDTDKYSYHLVTLGDYDWNIQV
jgi:hypothetical protein